MANESGSSDEDNLSRKRHWLAEENEKAKQVSKKRPKKGLVGFLFNPFNNFLSMFAGSDEKDGPETPALEIGDDDSAGDERIVEEKTEHALQDTTDYLTRESPERAAGGGGEVEVAVENQDEGVPEKNGSAEIQEIAATSSSNGNNGDVLERSFERQQDEEPAVIYEKVVKTPNRELQEARRFRDELIHLNERQDSPDDVSVVSGAGSSNFVSPTPYDSVSRSNSPMPLANYSPNNVRDFWRRSTSKRPTSARPLMRLQLRSTPSIPKVASGVQKAKRAELSSRDRLLQGVVASGQYEENAILGLTKWSKMKKSGSSTADIIARAKNKMHELKGSRSTTPTVGSSAVIEGSSCKLPRTPSVSSIGSSITPAQQSIKDLLSQIDSLGIYSSHRGPQRYEHAYESSKQKEDVLLEEARIRQEHRAQTREDRLEQTRKNLELIGIVQRPKVEKKKVDDFMTLPDAANTIIEKAWNRGLNAEEEFVTVASIPICRKDLDTLRGLNWLNDNIINVYLQMICDRSANDTKYPKTYFFNTFFYTNIVSKGYASVKRWTRKVDIFAHDVILIPVHLGMHWCMAVVDFPEKKIEFYDSLYDGNTQVLPALKNYLAAESLDKKKTAFDFSGWTIRQMEDIPRQQNGSDCGVFSCQFGEWASRRTAPRFTQKNMPYYRQRMVYEIVSQKLLSTI